MNKQIAFVTGNTSKYNQVKHLLAHFDPTITLEQVAIDLPECQTLDVQKIALGKAKDAWGRLQKPLIIEDGGIYLKKYNQFPGTLSKFVFNGIGIDGLLKLIDDNNGAYFKSCLVYIDGKNSYQFFQGTCNGSIMQPKLGYTIDPELPYTALFVPDGFSQTLKELHERKQYSQYHHRWQVIDQFVTWYNKKDNNHAIE